MRTMKDKERFFLITKIFLHLNGPSTAKEICRYIEKCPVNLLMTVSPVSVGSLLRGQSWVERDKEEGSKTWMYCLK